MRPASLATALLVALTALVPGLTAQPAGAASGRCEPGKGVTVVVDYARLRSGTDLFCARNGGGKTAAAIMSEAGVDYDYVAGEPFVCRIQSYPQDQTCQQTPPPNAYWGLFWSDGSPQTWTYANSGASSQRVPNGGSVGWRFQDENRQSPDAAPTAAPAPAPKPEPKPSPAESDGSGSGADSGPTRSASATPQEARTAAGGASPTASASAARGGSATDGPRAKGAAKTGDGKDGKDEEPERRKRSGERDRVTAPEESTVTDSAVEPVEEVEPLSASGEDSGSSGGLLPLLVGGLVALGLGSYAAIVAWRRRA